VSLYTVSSTITTTTALGIGPSVRFIIIEEVENKCVKSISGIKRLCDGKLEFRAKGGSDMVEYCINGKTIVTSNELIEFPAGDTGINRRAMYCHYSGRFTYFYSL